MTSLVDRLARPRLILRGAGALMLLAQGVVHLQLFNDGYRNIPNIGPLFLAGVIASAVLAVAVLVRPALPVVLAGIALSLGQVAGLIASRTTGILGFMTAGAPTSSEWSAVAAEVAAVIALAGIVVVGRTAQKVP